MGLLGEKLPLCFFLVPLKWSHQFRLELSRAYLEQVIRKMRLMTAGMRVRMTHRVLACSAGWVSGILGNHKHPPRSLC